MVEDIKWLGHDTFVIGKQTKVITDPFKIKGNYKADIVVITHDHFDHCVPEDVKKVQKEDTVVVATSDCAAKLSGNVKVVKPGDKISVKGVEIEAVPAYNTNKDFHKKAQGWVGYIITIDNKRIYLAGDTDRIPEMKDLKDIDIALLPVSGTYVMTAQEAVEAALDIRPKVAIPMHYGAIIGSEEDAKSFKEALQGKIEVVILRQED